MTLLDTFKMGKKCSGKGVRTSGANIYTILGHESSQDQILVAQS